MQYRLAAATGRRQSPVAPTIIWTPFLNRSIFDCLIQILRMLEWEGLSIDIYTLYLLGKGGNLGQILHLMGCRSHLFDGSIRSWNSMLPKSWVYHPPDYLITNTQCRTWAVIESHTLAVEPISDRWHLIPHSTSLRCTVRVKGSGRPAEIWRCLTSDR